MAQLAGGHLDIANEGFVDGTGRIRRQQGRERRIRTNLRGEELISHGPDVAAQERLQRVTVPEQL